MFVQPVALEAVPSYAVVERPVLVDALQELTGEGDLRGRLDGVYRRLEHQQPALAELIGAELSEVEGPAGQALLYFLFLLVYLAFDRAFPARVQAVDAQDLQTALARLIADGEVRESHCPARSYSEDAIAQGQPALMGLSNRELNRAGPDTPGLDAIFEALLLEVLVLSHAVAPVC
jgi:hypothetical protein